MSNGKVLVKALVNCGIKENGKTVSKVIGSEFEMDEKEALKAESDKAVEIIKKGKSK